MKKLLVYLLPLFLYANSSAQNDILYIGNNLSIRNSSTSQSHLPHIDSITFSGKADREKMIKSVAFVTDESGAVVIYTDGENLLDSKHQIITRQLNQSKINQCLFAKKPNSNDSYFFIYSAKKGIESSLYYYEITIKNDKVSLTKENVLLIDSVSESITLTPHANANDFWLIAHGWNNNKIFSIPISRNGMGDPEINEIGSFIGYNPFSALGQMKVSPDNTKLGIAIFTGYVELFDFDANTGRLSNPLKDVLDSFTGNPYSLEFSSDNKFLYITTVGLPSKIFQYEINDKNFSPNRELIYQDVENNLLFMTLKLSSTGLIFLLLHRL